VFVSYNISNWRRRRRRRGRRRGRRRTVLYQEYCISAAY
jgi:hypothetical protein